MRRPLQRVGTAVTVLVVLLLANITWIQVVKSDDYREDPNNRRTLVAEYSRQRGQITAAGGVVLARSDPVDDQYRYQRVYPGGPVYADLTGYYSMRYGPTGLERTQNDLLSGESPDLFAGQLSDLITGRDPRGGNVELTIVPAVQQAAYDALTAQGWAGAVVAIRPSTGEVLAMASTPSYDPNPLASHSDATQREAYNALVAPADPDAPSPLINRATNDVYPPGSTFKLIIAAAALQAGDTPETLVTGQSQIVLPGTGGATLSNFLGEDCADAGGADVTMTQALAFSCNTAFAELAMSLGADAVQEQAAAFGFGEDLSESLGLSVEDSRVGDIGDIAALAQTGIGQRDVVATPLQMAQVVAAIANRGEAMTPHVIARTTAPDLSVIEQTEPESLGQVVPMSVADSIGDMMIASERETPGSGSIAGLTIASKTGTAEHGVDPKNTPPHGWYVAYAPAGDPSQPPPVAVAVLVENGGNGDLAATGSRTAAPIGRAVLAAALAAGL
ncbi:penicillin-binding transpeptidase domain-containing protein [Nakamurella leprariae]|uniref:Penicillin-binding protein 2 n=1 Tax=Nakamurella leprariae TaxID=2803911 RepID=A0A939C2V0_9ACTN|nr:penicillin-binding protein 2 [Nakamurella leprariae]MBM9468477.1 penicillin-binding protein 2 [Nakamurella leprariae]